MKLTLTDNPVTEGIRALNMNASRVKFRNRLKGLRAKHAAARAKRHAVKAEHLEQAITLGRFGPGTLSRRAVVFGLSFAVGLLLIVPLLVHLYVITEVPLGDDTYRQRRIKRQIHWEIFSLVVSVLMLICSSLLRRWRLQFMAALIGVIVAGLLIATRPGFAAFLEQIMGIQGILVPEAGV